MSSRQTAQSFLDMQEPDMNIFLELLEGIHWPTENSSEVFHEAVSENHPINIERQTKLIRLLIAILDRPQGHSDAVLYHTLMLCASIPAGLLPTHVRKIFDIHRTTGLLTNRRWHGNSLALALTQAVIFNQMNMAYLSIWNAMLTKQKATLPGGPEHGALGVLHMQVESAVKIAPLSRAMGDLARHFEATSPGKKEIRFKKFITAVEAKIRIPNLHSQLRTYGAKIPWPEWALNCLE